MREEFPARLEASLPPSRGGSNPGAGAVAGFEAFDKRRARSSQYRPANVTAQVKEIHFASRGRAMAEGRLLPNTSIANVIDLGTGTVLDSIWCLLATPPDGPRLRSAPASTSVFRPTTN